MKNKYCCENNLQPPRRRRRRRTGLAILDNIKRVKIYLCDCNEPKKLKPSGRYVFEDVKAEVPKLKDQIPGIKNRGQRMDIQKIRCDRGGWAGLGVAEVGSYPGGVLGLVKRE